jgi:hypothetical protein
MNDLPTNITIESDGEKILSQEVLREVSHALKVSVDRDNGDVYLEFSSRRALYDFAKSLLHDAIFGLRGRKELYPLVTDGKALVVEGARLTEDSSRIFIDYPVEQ